MKNTTRIGLIGLFVAMSALNSPVDSASANQPSAESKPTIEDRLAKISATIRERENQLQETPGQIPEGTILAGGWGNGNDRGGWGNGNGRGWADGNSGGGWINNNSWRNGWRDGGSFFNN